MKPSLSRGLSTIESIVCSIQRGSMEAYVHDCRAEYLQHRFSRCSTTARFRGDDKLARGNWLTKSSRGKRARDTLKNPPGIWSSRDGKTLRRLCITKVDDGWGILIRSCRRETLILLKFAFIGDAWYLYFSGFRNFLRQLFEK